MSNLENPVRQIGKIFRISRLWAKVNDLLLPLRTDLFHFKDKDWYLVKALNVFQYVTFRTAYATITALLISLFFGGKLIEALKKWNVGQQIREEGPQGHRSSAARRRWVAC